MSEQRPPWFPGQFGRADGEAAAFTGDPYADSPTEAEPYAPASLPGQVTNPYGEVPAPPAASSEVTSWLADGGAGEAPGRKGAARAGNGTGSGTAQATSAAPSAEAGTAAAAFGAAVAPPESDAAAGYEDFYEPGSVDRSRLRRPRRQGGAQRRHGPRGRKISRRRRRTGAAATEARAATSIVVVPGGAATGAAGSVGRGPSPGTADATASSDGGGASPSTFGGRLTGTTGRDGSSSPRRRRGAVWLAALVVVGLGVVVGTQLARDDGPTAADPGPTVPPTPAPGTPGPAPDPLPSPTAVTPPPGEVAVGTTVAEGPFEVEVLGVSAGLGELTGATAKATAEGEFVVVRLRVTATDPGTSYFLDIDQRLLDPAGSAYEPDARAAMAVDGNRLWFAELSVGESAEGVVVFDVPPGTVPATLEVHAAAEGPGARVDLPTP